ncbi:hypothetical protein DVQ17_04505 [Yersinia enterocolitica]|nr:hypothetical protein [Yersinia enterocolitica]EKN6400329.1 hypothetical protein [Yersinia enterocolitica]
MVRSVTHAHTGFGKRAFAASVAGLRACSAIPVSPDMTNKFAHPAPERGISVVLHAGDTVSFPDLQTDGNCVSDALSWAKLNVAIAER